MRGLDEAGNPHTALYQEWDRWASQHATDARRVDWGAWKVGELPADMRLFQVSIDLAGYPLPLLEAYRKQAEQAHAPSAAGTESCSLTFCALGAMPPELLEELRAAEMAIKARYFPPVPQWLALNPPQWAIVLPGGEAVTMGELGTGRGVDTFGTWRNSRNLPQLAYCRYDAQGKLVGKLALGDVKWYKLFWPEAQQVLSQYDNAPALVSFSNGCVIVRRYGGQDVLAVFEYGGAPLPAATDPHLRDGNLWQGLYGEEIPALYAAQQRKVRPAGR